MDIMDKLTINFENCHGISKLSYNFEFTGNKKSYAIYAQNGTMKTSFAKTFQDFINGRETTDEIFPNRQTIREISNENGVEPNADDIFVIKSYDEDFKSKNMSYLLVNNTLKEKYDNIMQDLQQSEIDLIKKIKDISGSADCKKEILETFCNGHDKTFLEILEQVHEQLNEDLEPYNFKYNDIFDKGEKVRKFLLENGNFIIEYIRNYNELISQSDFFTNNENKFGTYQAKNILKSVSDDKYFKAGHKFKLKNGLEINTSQEYKNLIEEEIKRVTDTPELKAIFEKIDDELSKNESIRTFKEIIELNNSILVELQDYDGFRKKVWINYLSQEKTMIENLINLYNSKVEELHDIIRQAKDTETKRQNVINEFNDRFSNMPFRLSIENKDDVILKTDTPTIKFTYNDSRPEQEESIVDAGKLRLVLSQGEKRALYLLNIIFEIQARKAQGKDTLLIIDDIADSFDYKNKYAIIQYLKDLSEDPLFSMIILTHNFDFFRTICFRQIADGSYCKMVEKYPSKIEIINANYLRLFDYLRQMLSQGISDKRLITLIPFARNLAEYTLNDEKKLELVSFLHIKEDTNDKTVGDVVNIIESIFNTDELRLSNINTEKNILEFIFETAKKILEENSEILNLENKIVLSIAIRLKTEQFIINRINNNEEILAITSNQTSELIKKYEEKFPEDMENKKVFDSVNLITPENIHINSFMYEPIIDMSEDSLKDLYNKILELEL